MPRQELINLYQKLENAFGRKNEPARAEIFYNKTKDLSIDVVKNAVEEIIENEERFPSIAKIIQYIKKQLSAPAVKTAGVNDFIVCPRCKNTGWVDFEVDGYKFSCFCDCDLGKLKHAEVNESIEQNENISKRDKIKIAIWNENLPQQMKAYIKKFALTDKESSLDNEELEDAIPF